MDNRYFKDGCPPLMSDGRFITNYVESRVFEQQIRAINKLESAQDYKHFLQSNSETIMERERNYQLQNNTCSVNGACVPLSGRTTFCQSK
jgi:hypothetical protein